MSARKRFPAHHSRRMQPLDQAPTGVSIPDDVRGMWGSRDHLAVLYADPNGHERLSVNSTVVDRRTGHFGDDGLTWDDLMRIKTECGLRDRWAVEVFPPDAEVVNVANMRHLWLIDQPPYAWTGETADG